MAYTYLGLTDEASGRLSGIDAARALALVGMLCVHFGPEDAPGAIGAVYGAFHGRASILFAVVAGVGMALLSKSSLGVRGASYRLVSFAVVLLPLGLALQTLDHGIAVILQHYAVFFLLGALLVGLPGSVLLSLATLVTAAGPVVYLAGRAAWPDLVDRGSVVFGDAPMQILSGLLIAGPYPLLAWAAPILFGLGIGKLNPGKRHMPPLLMLAGTVLAGVSLAGSQLSLALWGEPGSVNDWRNLLITEAHSQMPLWIAQAVGFALAILGLVLWLERFAASGLRMALGTLALLGRYVLSVYVAHLLVLAVWHDGLKQEQVSHALLSVAAFVVAAMLGVLLWRRCVGGRGPVEMLLHLPWHAAREVSRDLAKRKEAAFWLR